jgi:hypothetical protein
MIPEQSPTGFLRQRIADLEELARRVDAELADKRARLERIERLADGPAAPARNTVPPGVDSRAVREWGLANGWALGDRGRLPADLITAYGQRARE